MKKIKLVLKATLFCLAAALSMGLAHAGTGTTNLLLNWSFEQPATGKITTGYDTIPYWFSRGTIFDSGVESGEVPPDSTTWCAYMDATNTDVRANQTTAHLIKTNECFIASIWLKNEWVWTINYSAGHTNGYVTVVLYYGGTADTVVGDVNTALGTVGTPFFTNTFLILPAPTPQSHTRITDWTNYTFGVITDSVPIAAIGQPLGIQIWNSSTQYNASVWGQHAWIEMDDVQLFATNGISPIATPVTISPTNRVFGGETLTFSESCFGSTPLTYQWRTDGGGGGALTNIPPGAVGVTGADTNIMQVVTSTNPGTYRFDLIVANDFGSVTTAVVSCTVRGLIAPIITQDTGTADFGPITNIFAFIGGNVNFYAAFDGTPTVTNQWQFGTNSLGITNPIVGATSNLWILTNVQFTSTGYYKMVATNAYGGTNTRPAHLSALTVPAALPTGGVTNMYSHWVMTNNPVAYWKFEETNDTLTSSMQAYDYSGHNFDATYGNSDGTASTGCLDGGENTNLNSQFGPIPGAYLNGYPGFNANNLCAGLSYSHNNGCLKVPPLNLNANTLTFTMWIYPLESTPVISGNSGLLMNRNGNDAAGVGFSGNQNANLTASLGYTWNNNNATTYGWNSGLYPLPQQWQYVAYVITPTNTTIYLYYVGGNQTNLYKAVNNLTNTPEAFSGGTTWMGGDNNDNNRTFNGCIDEVAVFTNAMSEIQVQDLFLRALGLTNGVAPSFTQLPASTPVFLGQVLQIPSIAGGIPSPSYQWQFQSGGNWFNCANSTSTGVFGATNATFGWTNYGVGTYFTQFRCIAYNAYGSTTSSPPTGVSALIIPVANWNVALWTVNFAVPTSINGGPGTTFVGHGVLGTNYTYWNALTGGNFANTPPSLLADGVTHCPVNLSCTNYGNTAWYNAGSHLLLDEYMYFGTNETSMVFTSVPNGKYNLAVYMIDAGPQPSYADRGTTVTVKGVSHSITNAQDVSLLSDNTVVYTNLVVTNGMLEVHLQPYDTPLHTPNTEGDFNGAQLELLVYGPNILSYTNKGGTNFVLTYVGGKVLEATNIAGPWTTNTTVASGAITINPTGHVRFYRIMTNTTWEN